MDRGVWVRPVGRFEVARCRRFLAGSKRWTFRPAAANHAVEWISRTPHVVGAWPTPLLELAPWQILTLVELFGWADPETGERRFTQAYISTARANGKTSLAALIGLYEFVSSPPGARVVSVATTQQQAQMVVDIASEVVRHPRSAWIVRDHGLVARASRLERRASGEMRALASRRTSLEGLVGLRLGIVDEMASHGNDGVLKVMESGRGKMADTWTLVTTTAGENAEGPGYDHDRACRTVLTGDQEGPWAETQYVVVCALDKEDDPLDPTVWEKAAPLLGSSAPLRRIYRQEADKAARFPGDRVEFEMKRVNRWRRAAAAWIDRDLWARCADETVSWEAIQGGPVSVGGDLAGRQDITAIAACWFRGQTPLLAFRLYLPEESIPKLADGRPWIRDWVESGHLVLTPGDWIDHAFILRDLRELESRATIFKCYLDQYSGAASLAVELTESGIETQLLAKTARNYGTASLDFEARINTRRLAHDGNPCAAWMVGNAVVDRRIDGSILPKKVSAASREKIDAVDAAILALIAASDVDLLGASGGDEQAMVV